MPSLLKLGYRLSTLFVGLAGRGYKAKGFSFYLREEIHRRCGVIAGLYQKRLDNRFFIDRRNEHDPVLEEYLGEYGSLEQVKEGRAFQKRIAVKPGDDK